MKKFNNLLFMLSLLFYSVQIIAQEQKMDLAKVGTQTTSIHASAVLEVESTNKGFLPPRMSTEERNLISSPAIGLTIFNTTDNCLNIWIGQWKNLCVADELGDVRYRMINENNGPGVRVLGLPYSSNNSTALTLYGFVENTSCFPSAPYRFIVHYVAGLFFYVPTRDMLASGGGTFTVAGSGTGTLSITHSTGCSGNTDNVITLSVVNGQIQAETTTDNGFFRYRFTALVN